MRLAVIIALLALVMNLFIQPAAYRELRNTLFDVRTDLAATLVREGEFTEPAPGLTVYAQSVDSRGRMGNLFIHVAESDGAATTYTADEGRMATRGGTPVLVMSRGSTQEFSPTGVLNYLTFDEYIFDLGPLVASEELVHYKPSDRYLHELFFPDLEQDWEQRNRLEMLAEGHARLATPLYNIAFMALALAAILGGGYDRMGYGRRIAWAGAAAALSRILGFVVQAASESGAWINLLQYVVPLLTMGLALHGVFRQRVSRFIDMRQRPVRIARAGASA
tara:strand:- start:8490 stop:9323 length:834 start_codon:yes stop_codon:yes gene_type:complete